MSDWQTINDHENYEINVNYPYAIRKKGKGKEKKETLNSEGYYTTNLDQHNYKKHRIIALQWIPNPEFKPMIDHINHQRSDNHIENLRWATSKDNNNNAYSYNRIVVEYVDEIPDEAIVVEKFNNWTFENLFYYDNIFYLYNGLKYRKLHITHYKGGSSSVFCSDIHGNKRTLMYARFKREYELI
jgi:hypothetical protein